MAKLILVSHREPYALKRGRGGVLQTQRVTGGLIGALAPAMGAYGGHWISWSGLDRDAKEKGEPLPERLEVTLGLKPCSLRRIPLTEREASLYYYGFASRTLWPLSHLALGRVQFDAEAWRAYRRVNQRFADAALEAADAGDLIWVHDFHLALVPAMVREKRPDARIGFSWHIPWAPPDALRALPWAREIMEGVLAADHVSLPLPRYGRQFLACAEEILGAGVEGKNGEGHVTLAGRTTRVSTIPSGCDFERWEERGRASRGGKAVRLRRHLVADRLALAVDRLDHTRGVVERLRAIERFFDRYPSWRGRLVFCQIAVPSRTRSEEYRELKREVDDLVGAINARFQQGAWQPIRYVYRALEPDELAVHYAAADVALVTPLADGVSYVPFEYVASRVNGDGALVLSTLAGAADALPEAFRVNPHDIDSVAAVIHDVLESRADDLQSRMRVLRHRAQQESAAAWLQRSLHTAFGEEISPAALSEPPAADISLTAMLSTGALASIPGLSAPPLRAAGAPAAGAAIASNGGVVPQEGAGATIPVAATSLSELTPASASSPAVEGDGASP